MAERKRYQKRQDKNVSAVQLNIECEGFQYRKRGHIQQCRQGDWLVNNNGEVYTVDNDYFHDNYHPVSPGLYEKTGEVWAEIASRAGAIKTLEGITPYKAGDYLVFDREKGGNGYSVRKHLFEKMYELLQAPQKKGGDDETEERKEKYLKHIEEKKAEYYKKARFNQIFYHVWRIIAILTAAMVPVVSAFISGQTVNTLKWPVVLLGSISVFTTGVLSLFKCEYNWIQNTKFYLELDSHINQFNASSGIYADKPRPFREFVTNCEKIIMEEKKQWTLKKIGDST